MAPNPVSLLMRGLNLLIFLGCAAVGALAIVALVLAIRKLRRISMLKISRPKIIRDSRK